MVRQLASELYDQFLENGNGFAMSANQIGFYRNMFVSVIPTSLENKIDGMGAIEIESSENEWEKYETGYKNISNKIGCFVNTKIIEYDREIDWYPETCLSLCSSQGKPHTYFIPRSKRIKIEFETLLLKQENDVRNKITCELSGFSARVFQHEVDHQHGLLICDLHQQLLVGKPRLEEFDAYLKFSNKKPELDAEIVNAMILDGVKRGTFKMNESIQLKTKSEQYFASLFEINRLLDVYMKMKK